MLAPGLPVVCEWMAYPGQGVCRCFCLKSYRGRRTKMVIPQRVSGLLDISRSDYGILAPESLWVTKTQKENFFWTEPRLAMKVRKELETSASSELT